MLSLEQERDELLHINQQYVAEIARLRAAAKAAVRCAKLALFVIRKQGVMPNSSWESGFIADLKIAEDALHTIEPT